MRSARRHRLLPEGPVASRAASSSRLWRRRRLHRRRAAATRPPAAAYLRLACCLRHTRRTLARLRSRGNVCHAVTDTRVPFEGALASWGRAGAAGERRGASRRRADDGAHFDTLSSRLYAAREADSGGPYRSPLGQRRPEWSTRMLGRVAARRTRSVEVVAALVWLAALGLCARGSMVTDKRSAGSGLRSIWYRQRSGACRRDVNE